MSNFPNRQSSSVLKGYDHFKRLWVCICKLFPSSDLFYFFFCHREQEFPIVFNRHKNHILCVGDVSLAGLSSSRLPACPRVNTSVPPTI